MKKHIPNSITIGNLFCGLAAIKFSFYSNFEIAGYFILIALVLDFLDGFTARLLKVQSEVGKQLDSLADMVTFGVAPGCIMFMFLLGMTDGVQNDFLTRCIPYVAFSIPIMSAIRLARFNISTEQSEEFIGLPTPANAIFFSFIPLIVSAHSGLPSLLVDNYFFYAVIIILFSLLLNAKIPLIALKFKSFSLSENKYRFLFIVLALVAVLIGLFLHSIFATFPIIVTLYLIISLIKNSLSTVT